MRTYTSSVAAPSISSYRSPVATSIPSISAGYGAGRIVGPVSSTVSPFTSTISPITSTISPAPVSTTISPAPVSTIINPAPVSTVISPAPAVAAPVATIADVRPLSRDEMIQRGILVQAGEPAPQVVSGGAFIQESGRYFKSLDDVWTGAVPAPSYDSHHFQSNKWQSVNPRPDDIVIITAYKSGTTWMQQIISEILFSNQGVEKPASVGDMSPWVDLRVPPAEVLGPMLEGQQHRRFLKTHMPADAFLPYFNQEAKYIYVARDGRDAFMSILNHYEKGNDMWYGALNGAPGLVGDPLPHYNEACGGNVPALFDRWLTEGWHTHPDEVDGWPFWSWFKNAKTWWTLATAGNFPNILFVHFNNMKADLDGEMRRIAEFLEVPVNENAWAQCVQNCTFDAMHSNADQVAPLNGAMWEGGGKSFIFKGTNNRWQGVLSDAQVQAYEEKALMDLGPECARFMATGQL